MTFQVQKVAASVPPETEPRSLHDLLDQLRGYQVGRVAYCGRGLAYGQTEVEIQRVEEKFARLKGIFRCGSVWSCPVCAMRIHAQRAAEITRAIDWWGMDRVLLLTLTVRHREGEDLGKLRRELCKTWAALQQSRWWRDSFKEDLGLAHMIRVQEVTHGAHGWHPHLHVALFIGAIEGLPLRNLPIENLPSMMDRLQEELRRRWRDLVFARMGSGHEPNEHGVDLGPTHRQTYLAKLGLEIAFSRSKESAGRSVWKLMGDLAARRDPRDVALWRQYSEAYKGAQQLRWSTGLKKLVKLAQVSDEDCASEEGRGSVDAKVEFIGKVPAATWRQFAARRGAIGRLVSLVQRGGDAPAVGALFVAVLGVALDEVQWDTERRMRWVVEN